jgi:ubiquinone/menaquinone biosynthesis C-methylase UbiE
MRPGRRLDWDIEITIDTAPVARAVAVKVRHVSVYGRIFAAMYDRMVAGTEKAGLGERRQELLADARGRVLEIGAGTGVNIQHYPAGVEELVFTEPEEPMARRLEARLASSGRSGTVVRAPAEQLPFEDDSFDTVVSTLVLCTVNDPVKALAEIERVLRPGGAFLFIEHVRAEDPGLARWQDRIAPLWRRFGHGCNCNRPTPALIRDTGFGPVDMKEGELPKAPPIVRPLVAGRAQAL